MPNPYLIVQTTKLDVSGEMRVFLVGKVRYEYNFKLKIIKARYFCMSYAFAEDLISSNSN